MASNLQHNVDRSLGVPHCLLETAKEKGTDLVLAQVLPNNPDFRPTRGLDFLWAKGWALEARRIVSEWAFMNSFTRETEGDVQVLAVGRRGRKELQLRTVNAYFQRRGRECTCRPAERARWGDISADGPGILVALSMLTARAGIPTALGGVDRHLQARCTQRRHGNATKERAAQHHRLNLSGAQHYWGVARVIVCDHGKALRQRGRGTCC